MSRIKHLHRDHGARLRIGQGVVMLGEVVAAMRGDSIEFVALQLGKENLRSAVRAVNLILRLADVIIFEQRLQTVVLKGLSVRHYR